MNLILKNNVTKTQYEITGLTDLNTSVLYWTFDVVLPEDIIEGDYNWELVDNNTVMATGLCRVGDYTPEVTTHTASTGNYIVYN